MIGGQPAALIALKRSLPSNARKNNIENDKVKVQSLIIIGNS